MTVSAFSFSQTLVGDQRSTWKTWKVQRHMWKTVKSPLCNWYSFVLECRHNGLCSGRLFCGNRGSHGIDDCILYDIGDITDITNIITNITLP